MSDEELREMEGAERDHVEARIRCLRNIQVKQIKINPRERVAHPQVVGEVICLKSNTVITKDVKNGSNCCYVRCVTLIVRVGGMPWLKTGTTYYHTGNFNKIILYAYTNVFF